MWKKNLHYFSLFWEKNKMTYIKAPLTSIQNNHLFMVNTNFFMVAWGYCWSPSHSRRVKSPVCCRATLKHKPAFTHSHLRTTLSSQFASQALVIRERKLEESRDHTEGTCKLLTNLLHCETTRAAHCTTVSPYITTKTWYTLTNCTFLQHLSPTFNLCCK